MEYELDEELSAAVKRINKLFEGYTPGDLRRAARSGARFDRVREGWVAPAAVAGAVALGSGLIAADRGKLGDKAQEIVQPVTRPIKKVFNWDKGRASTMRLSSRPQADDADRPTSD